MFQPYRTAYRGAIILALGPGPAASARWSTGAIPTLENALELASPAVRARCPHWRIALHDDTQASPLDTADGHYEPVLARLSGSVPATIEDMSRAFTDMIAPLGSAPGTRNKAARNWRTCLTWAIGRDTAAQLLPMTSETLSAMLWDFTAMGASKSTLKSIVDAVLSRHRAAGATSPLSGPMAYSRLARCLGRLLGRQHPHKMGITRDMIVSLLRYQPKNLVEFRNKNVTCTLTMGCMRPGEGARTTTCNLLFNSDYNKGLKQYLDCSTLITNQRKNDQERKGHQMRFGKSQDSELDINHQLGLFMDLAGTRPDPECQGAALRGRRCPKCKPLFPKLLRGPDNAWVLHPDPEPTPALISSMVVSALRMINVDTTAFTGVCCRMGGLTIATEAGVPENIMWMQSGHAQDRAARRYVRLTNPDRLYDTWRAFNL
jgi:hypothetical protein